MFEILQYICGYRSDKRTKEKSNKNKYICIDGDMWWADFWELMTYKFQLFLSGFLIWPRNCLTLQHIGYWSLQKVTSSSCLLTVLSWNGCNKILKFLLHDISFFIKGFLKSIIRTISFLQQRFTSFCERNTCIHSYLWHLNHAPVKESQLALWVS